MKRRNGYTLVEMVSVISILSIVGLVTSYTIMESMRVYARTVPALDAGYQARLAAERMRRELRDLASPDSITTMTASAVTFDDSLGNTIAYSLSGGDLLRNTDLLAAGVTSLSFDYWQSDGTAATVAADLHLFEFDLTVQVVDQPYRVQATVFPRVLSPVSGSGGSGGIAATPIAHWKLDETSGTTAVDSIAANDGTVQNGVTLGVTGAPSGDTAFQFDGIDDHVEVAHSASYLIANGTIQLWFNADAVGGKQMLFSKDSSGYDTGGHVTMYLNGDDVEVRLQSTSQTYQVTASNVVTVGTWHYAAFTFGDDGMKLYVDAVLHDTDPYTGGLGATSGGSGNAEPFAFGANTWSSGDGVVTPIKDHYEGRIDAVAIYAEALSAADISTLYSAGGAID